MVLSNLDVLNIIQIAFLIVLAAIAIRITFAAYIDGVRRRLDDLKRHCQFLGVAIVALTGGSMFVGADITARCYLKVENMEQEVEKLSAQRETQLASPIQVATDAPLWTVITPSGNEITWRQEDDLRKRTFSGGQPYGRSRYIGPGSGSSHRDINDEHARINPGQFRSNDL